MRRVFLCLILVSFLSVCSLSAAGIVTDKDTLRFGFVGIAQSRSVSFEILNSENTDIAISGIQIQDGNSFNAFGPKNYVLSPGGKVNVEVYFSPVERGLAEDDLIIEYVINSSIYKKKIHLEGAGEVSYYESWQSPFRVRKGTDVSDYMLLSFPGQISNPITYLKKNFGDYNPSKWRAFIYIGRWQELKDAPAGNNVEAFFLIQNQEVRNLQSQNVLTIKDTVYKILLKKGWNLIRNPYSFPVSTTHISLTSGLKPVVYGFNGAWRLETILYPWFGYAIYSENEDILEIHGYQQIKSGTLHKREFRRMNQIVVRCEEYVDSLNYFGVDYSPVEIREPDLFKVPVQAYFVNDENKKLAVDVRQWAESWTLRIEATPGEKVKITFPDLPLFGSWFIRDEKGKETRIFSGYSVMYEQSKDICQFQIILKASSAYETPEKQINFVDIFPNPGNPVFHFMFTAQQDALVRIEIFNILGERIKTVYHSMVSKGSYRIRWDGMDENGQSVPSGIYFAQIQIGSRRIARKIIVLK